MNKQKNKTTRKHSPRKKADSGSGKKSAERPVSDKSAVFEETLESDSFEEQIDAAGNSAADRNFREDLIEASKNLFYQSEIDSEIEVFFEDRDKFENPGQKNSADFLSNVEARETDFEDFFKDLTVIEDWFEKEEIETAEKFKRLRDLLFQNLENLKVYKIGKIEIEIYIAGFDKNGNLAGIKTKAVET